MNKDILTNNIDILDEKIIQCNDAVHAFNFTGLSEAEHRKILSWRMHPDTILYSETKEIDWDSHMAFVENLKKTREQAYWLIKHNQQPVAICNLHNISDVSTFSGNYIVPGMTGYGVLANLVVHDIVFNKLKLPVISGEIAPNNHSALRMAKIFNVEITPIENGYLKVVHHRKEWQKQADKYAKLMNVFK